MKKSSENSAVLKLTLLLGLILLPALAGGDLLAQKNEHYDSPLYAPRTYDPERTTSNGLPKALDDVGIVQKLGGQVPPDAEFRNARGERVRLGRYFGKRPLILALVYYECPMLCNEVLNGLTGSLKGINFNAGEDFDVIALSFDAREHNKAELAKNKKEGYLERYGRPGAENGWHFLTGRQEEIDKVTEAVGFNYRFDEETNQFAHAGGVIILTPEGKISRYFYGIDYAPKDIKFGLMDSADGKVGNPVEQLYLYCFHYDPSTGKYGLAILRVLRLAAVATLVGLGLMLFFFWRRGRRGGRGVLR